MSMTPSCGLGHNGGSLLDDLAPLDGVYSLTIAEATKRTGLSRSRLYRFLDAGRLRSLKVGKQRLLIAQSLRQLLSELAAGAEAAAAPRLRRRGSRFAPSAKENTTPSSGGADRKGNGEP